MQVRHMASIFSCTKTHLVCGANCLTSFDATTGQPHTETVMVVISPRFSHSFTGGGTAKFSPPDHQRVFPGGISVNRSELRTARGPTQRWRVAPWRGRERAAQQWGATGRRPHTPEPRGATGRPRS